MRRKRATVPAFLELSQNGKRAFVPFDVYLHDPEFRGQVVNLALANLANGAKGLGTFSTWWRTWEGQAIVHQIDKLKERFGRNWPTLTDDPLV